MHNSNDLENSLAQYNSHAKQAESKVNTRGLSTRKLLSYTAAASSAFVFSATADAAIIYSGVSNVTDGSVDVNNDGVTDFSFFGSVSSAYGLGKLYAFGGAQYIKADGPGAGGFDVKKFSSGNAISAGAGVFGSAGDGSFRFVNTSSGTVGGDWGGALAPNTTSGFAGVKVKDNGNDIFAWLRLSVENNALGQPIHVTLIDWAYEDSGAAIITGATTSPVPLPGSLGLLAMGASGLAAFRRRKDKNKA